MRKCYWLVQFVFSFSLLFVPSQICTPYWQKIANLNQRYYFFGVYLSHYAMLFATTFQLWMSMLWKVSSLAIDNSTYFHNFSKMYWGFLITQNRLGPHNTHLYFKWQISTKFFASPVKSIAKTHFNSIKYAYVTGRIYDSIYLYIFRISQYILGPVRFIPFK